MKKSEEREVKMEKLVRRGGGGHSHGGGHGHFHGSGGSHHYGGHYGGEHSSGEHSRGHSDGEGDGKSKKSGDDEQENSSSFWRSRGSHSSSSGRINCESIVDAKERENCINRSQNIGLFDIFIIFAGVILFIGSGFYKIIKKLS
jgi:zinc transporter 7-A